MAAEGLDTQTQQLWDRHWRVYAQRCSEFEGGYLCSPTYDRRYPSSAGMTVRQAEAELSKKVKVGGGGVVVTKTVKMPIGEAEAMARPIPKLSVGQYGFLASVEVAEVLGPTSMVVEDLYLIDPAALREEYRADRDKARHADDTDAAGAALEYVYRHRDALVKRQKDKRHRRVVLRLEGYSTDGLFAGDRWSGPMGEGLRVLIVKPENYGNKKRSRQRLVGLSLKDIRWGLSEAAFIEMLGSRGMDPEGFIALIMEKMAEDDPKTAKSRVFNSLLPTLDKPDEPAEDSSPDVTRGSEGVDAG